MTQLTHASRPREKAQARSMRALTNHELLQIIIGSGSKQASVSYIARKVGRLLLTKGEHIDVSDLQAIKGVGAAQATKILAVVELGNRLNEKRRSEQHIEKLIVGHARESVSGKTTVVCYVTFDGSGRVLRLRRMALAMDDVSLPGKLLSDALLDGAASIAIAAGGRTEKLELTQEVLMGCRRLYDGAVILGISIRQCLLVSSEGHRSLL